MASLKSVIDKSKGLKVPAVRPLVLAAEENLHNMVVDLDKVVTKVSMYCKKKKNTCIGSGNMLIKVTATVSQLI